VPLLRDVFRFPALHPVDLVICLSAGVGSMIWFEFYKCFQGQEQPGDLLKSATVTKKDNLERSMNTVLVLLILAPNPVIIIRANTRNNVEFGCHPIASPIQSKKETINLDGFGICDRGWEHS
jgi:hypothetical protein